MPSVGGCHEVVSPKKYFGDKVVIDFGANAIMRCEYIVLVVVLDDPPPTLMPLAKVPAAPPIPNAPVTAPRLTPAPPDEVFDVVVDYGI